MMWARTIELLCGCWLVASPFAFGLPREEIAGWSASVGGGLLIIGVSIYSFMRPLGHAYLCTLGLSLLLIGFGRLIEPEPSPFLQNMIFVGLLLVMFAIV